MLRDFVGFFDVCLLRLYLCSTVNVVCEVVLCVSDRELVESQKPFLSRKREASVALEHETGMDIERTPVKAVPEAVRNRPTQQRSPCTAVPECMHGTAPRPSEGTPLQIRPIWRDPLEEPSAEAEAVEVEDYDPPWTAPERVALDNTAKSASIKVDVSELEHFLLEQEDSDISITSFAENGRDEGGFCKFVFLDTPRGKGAGRGVEVEAAMEVRRREAASATRRTATRSVQ